MLVKALDCNAFKILFCCMCLMQGDFRFPLLFTHLRGKFHLGRARGQSASVVHLQPRKGWTSTVLSHLWCTLGRKVNPAMSLQVKEQIPQWLYEQLFTDAFKTLLGQQSLQQLTDTICPQQHRSTATALVIFPLLKATSLSHWRSSPGKPQVTAVLFFFGALWSVHSQIIKV